MSHPIYKEIFIKKMNLLSKFFFIPLRYVNNLLFYFVNNQFGSQINDNMRRKNLNQTS